MKYLGIRGDKDQPQRIMEFFENFNARNKYGYEYHECNNPHHIFYLAKKDGEYFFDLYNDDENHIKVYTVESFKKEYPYSKGEYVYIPGLNEIGKVLYMKWSRCVKKVQYYIEIDGIECDYMFSVQELCPLQTKYPNSN